MAVLKGEGRVPILFGTYSLPVAPNRPAYIARPDLGGAHPVIVVAHDRAGLTSGVKATARVLARHGYAAIVPDLSRGSDTEDEFEWSVADLAAAVDTARVPGTTWASDQMIGLVGIGAGGIAASVVAADEEAPLLALIGSPLDATLLEQYRGVLMVLHGSDDESTPGDEVRQIQSELDRGEWILYGGVSGGFFDESSDSYEEEPAQDAVDRLIDRLDATFSPVGVG